MGRKVKTGGSTAVPGESDSHTWEVIKSLVASETDASKLLEMYYWTREPGIFDIIRAYLDVPDSAQRNLSDFLLKHKPQTVASIIDEQGRLLLSAGQTPSRKRSAAN